MFYCVIWIVTKAASRIGRKAECTLKARSTEGWNTIKLWIVWCIHPMA